MGHQAGEVVHPVAGAHGVDVEHPGHRAERPAGGRADEQVRLVEVPVHGHHRAGVRGPAGLVDRRGEPFDPSALLRQGHRGRVPVVQDPVRPGGAGGELQRGGGQGVEQRQHVLGVQRGGAVLAHGRGQRGAGQLPEHHHVPDRVLHGRRHGQPGLEQHPVPGVQRRGPVPPQHLEVAHPGPVGRPQHRPPGGPVGDLGELRGLGGAEDLPAHRLGGGRPGQPGQPRVVRVPPRHEVHALVPGPHQVRGRAGGRGGGAHAHHLGGPPCPGQGHDVEDRGDPGARPVVDAPPGPALHGQPGRGQCSRQDRAHPGAREQGHGLLLRARHGARPGPRTARASAARAPRSRPGPRSAGR